MKIMFIVLITLTLFSGCVFWTHTATFMVDDWNVHGMQVGNNFSAEFMMGEELPDVTLFWYSDVDPKPGENDSSWIKATRWVDVDDGTEYARMPMYDIVVKPAK